MSRSRIYTKTGDRGETSLVEGKRVSKADSRIEAYGTIDELNSVIGLAVSFIDKKLFSVEFDGLVFIQNRLFNIGSRIACSDDVFKKNLPNIEPQDVKHLESEIDRMNAGLPELRDFILPGGSSFAAALHLARTIARRAERLVFRYELDKEEPDAAQFLNRLSDYFFVLARFANSQNNHSETIWQKQ